MKKLTVNEAYKIAFLNISPNTMFSTDEIVKMVSEYYTESKDSILPRDHCYNSWNKGIESMEWVPLFEFMYDMTDNKKFKYLGENASYTGKVRHKPKGGKTVYIGEWIDGVFKKYDSPLEIEGERMFNKDILKKYVTEYKENIKEWRFGTNREIYKWEAIEHFQKHWNINAVDFVEMLKAALDKTENLLTVGLFFAKGMLIGLATKEPETVRGMFKILFDENLDLNKRISDFIKQADELHKRNPGGKSHYQGTRAISVYLWLMYPKKYYIYQYAIYDTNVKALKADYLIKANGKPETLVEGYKFYNEIREELANDEELVELNNKYSLENYRDVDMTTLTIDLGFYIYKQNEWKPSLKEYDPKISAEQWRELWNDEEVFDESSKNLMNQMMLLDGEASCSQLAETFLGDAKLFRTYNTSFMHLGKRIHKKTDCHLFNNENTEGKNFWSVVSFYKLVDKSVDEDVKGQYIFKLRQELQDVLKELGLPQSMPIYNGKGKEQKAMPKHHKNLILYGPPGTGKTYNAINYAVAILENKTFDEIKKEDRKSVLNRFNQNKKNGLVEFCTFHQSFGYEEFIQGIKPFVKDEKVVYKVQDGVFKRFCDKAKENLEQNYVFIIDEINRGNISKIFGELITLIEDSKRIGSHEEMRVHLSYSEEDNKAFGVPNNVYLLGTMNTADRSIALIDTALRRRFKFKEMQPDVELLDNVKVDGIEIGKMLKVINNRIEVIYDREHTIGHSYFMNLKKNPEISLLKEIFKGDIIPLLQEYFYDDFEKIALILGDDVSSNDLNKNFITKKKFELGSNFKVDIELNAQYQINDKAFETAEAYKKIYE